MRPSPWLLAILLVVAGGPATADTRAYIKSDKPVTCSVSYQRALVVVELHASEECRVEVWTGFRNDLAAIGDK